MCIKPKVIEKWGATTSTLNKFHRRCGGIVFFLFHFAAAEDSRPSLCLTPAARYDKLEETHPPKTYRKTVENRNKFSFALACFGSEEMGGKQKRFVACCGSGFFFAYLFRNKLADSNTSARERRQTRKRNQNSSCRWTQNSEEERKIPGHTADGHRTTDYVENENSPPRC